MYKKLCVGLLLCTTAFLFAQKIDFSKKKLPCSFSNCMHSDAGILFGLDEGEGGKLLFETKFLSQAGILDTSTLNQNHEIITINKLDKLKQINLKTTMLHEISVSIITLIHALEEIFAPLKIKNKKELEKILMKKEKDREEKFIYYQYLRYIIESLQQKNQKVDKEKKINQKVDKELKCFAGHSFIQKQCISLRKLAFSLRSQIQQINSRRFVNYVIISLMLYKFLY